MKLHNLLDVITGPTVIWISTEYEADGVFLGFAEDASANTPGEYLFGDVRAVYPEYYKAYGRTRISIIVAPYKSSP